MAHMAHYKEAHPLPFVIAHWVNLVCMLGLMISGFLIHFPFLQGLMGMARGLHLFCAVVIMLNLAIRIVLAFIVKTSPTGGTRQTVIDYKTWLPQKDNRHQGIAWIKYYLFIKKDHPLSAKLGVPQKITYLLIPVLLILACWSGMCLLPIFQKMPPFAATIDAVGGLMSIRIIHYFLMFVFIIFMLIHIYLANIEGFESTKLMFLHKEHGGYVYDPDVHNIVGEDLDPHVG